MQEEPKHFFEENSSEKDSFEEKMQECEENLDCILRKEFEGEDMKDERKAIEEEYVSLVCQAKERDFIYWCENNVQKLLKDMFKRANPEDDELLITKFLLCKKAREAREEH